MHDVMVRLERNWNTLTPTPRLVIKDRGPKRQFLVFGKEQPV